MKFPMSRSSKYPYLTVSINECRGTKKFTPFCFAGAFFVPDFPRENRRFSPATVNWIKSILVFRSLNLRTNSSTCFQSVSDIVSFQSSSAVESDTLLILVCWLGWFLPGTRTASRCTDRQCGAYQAPYDARCQG